jgi:hypothetical protein
LKAYDKKPAGDKLYQGVSRKSINNRNIIGKAHDIFKMPKSLGGNRE